MFKLEHVSEEEFNQFKRELRKLGVGVSSPNDVSPQFSLSDGVISLTGCFTGEAIEVVISKRPFWLPEYVIERSLETILESIYKSTHVDSPEVVVEPLLVPPAAVVVPEVITGPVLVKAEPVVPEATKQGEDLKTKLTETPNKVDA